MDLIKSFYHNYKKNKIFLNLTIKELRHISLILLINHLSLSNPNNNLDLIKLSYQNYKKNKIFLNLTIKELHHISLILLKKSPLFSQPQLSFGFN